MMKTKIFRERTNLPTMRAWLAAVLATFATLNPMLAAGAWEVVATDQGKHVEVDRESIKTEPRGTSTAKGRIVLDRPIVDPKTSDYYRIIEIESRYDCKERTHATLKRSYYKEEGELLRQEEVRSPFDMPVRSGTPDYNLYRAACRPEYKGEEAISASKAAQKVDEVAEELRKWNEAQVAAAVQKDLKHLVKAATPTKKATQASPAPDTTRETVMTAPRATPRRKTVVAKDTVTMPSNVPWSYGGDGAPEHWGKLKADYATCGEGKRQSPIDIRNGIAVDLEPIAFDYRPAAFKVSDTGRNLQITVFGGGFSLLGNKYQLTRIQFHRPAEFTIAGNTYAMEAQLEHRADDGKLAIVSVLLEPGAENPVVQAALNNLPLRRGGDLMPPGQRVDPARLLPEQGQYYTFLGSLTTPPCTEDVLWLVMKQAHQVSAEQIDIFKRLYPANARPVQPGFARIIKESR